MNVAAAVISFLAGGFSLLFWSDMIIKQWEFWAGFWGWNEMTLGLFFIFIPPIITIISGFMLLYRKPKAVTLLVISAVLSALTMRFPPLLITVANIIAIILASHDGKKQQKVMQAAETPQAQENKAIKERGEVNVAAAVISFLAGGFSLLFWADMIIGQWEFLAMLWGRFTFWNQFALLFIGLLPSIINIVSGFMLLHRNSKAVTLLVISAALSALIMNFPSILVAAVNIIIILTVLNSKKQQKLMQAAETPQAQENK